MTTLHVVSHTHWDREWYLTFQEFRYRLVRMMDGLLDLLDSDPEYAYFTLDGQTVVLDDYLEIRPQEEGRIRKHVRDGRLLVGPWYVLPDEFLCGPEALVRNLLFGERGCRRFTHQKQPMECIGYVPDPFGHISQLPQIAAGCGWDAVCLWRGVGHAPTEFRWSAPDGSDCLVLHLANAYSNGAHLATDVEGFACDLAAERDALVPLATTPHILVMQGNDHVSARHDIPRLIQAASTREHLDEGDRVLHSTLPHFLQAVLDDLGTNGLGELPDRHGELRSPETARLLPAVLSARIWIKQWNARCETLLTRWAEPFAVLADQVGDTLDHRPFLRKSWEYLLKNHPHDSICGCSVDQVHREMETRFSWSEQVAEQVVSNSLRSIAAQIDTRPNTLGGSYAGPSNSEASAVGVVVFNPSGFSRTDRVRVHLPHIANRSWSIVDGRGVPLQHEKQELPVQEHLGTTMTRESLASWLDRIASQQSSDLDSLFLRRLETRVSETGVDLNVFVTSNAAGSEPETSVRRTRERLQALLDDKVNQTFRVRVLEEGGVELEFLAKGVPALGYAQYTIVDLEEPATALPSVPTPESNRIESEHFVVEANREDGTLTILDKSTGLAFQGANRFVDGGDRGDEYTFCPPEADTIIDSPAAPPTVEREDDALGCSLRVSLNLRVPHSLLGDDRSARSEDLVDLPITSRITLIHGVRRIEFETTVDNHAKDHRLRVHFPTPVVTESSWAESQFDVVERPITLPTDTEDWAEQPVGTHPQLSFVDVSNGQHGVLLANRGLPEYQVLPGSDEAPGTILALTLLRAVGWLSRADLHNRVGHAGPAVTTPEAQCLGSHTFHYALVPHAGNYLTAYREAHAFNSTLRAVPAEAHEGPLPGSASFVEVSPSAVVISTLKHAEEGGGFILRLLNIAEIPVQARLRFLCRFEEATQVSLLEAGIRTRLARDTDQLSLPMRAKEIATIHIRTDRDVGKQQCLDAETE
jgi:alpha-mannosidase